MALTHKFSDAVSLTYAKNPRRFLFKMPGVSSETLKESRDMVREMFAQVPVDVETAYGQALGGSGPVIAGFNLNIDKDINDVDLDEVRDEVLKILSERGIIAFDDVPKARKSIDLENEYGLPVLPNPQ